MLRPYTFKQLYVTFVGPDLEYTVVYICKKDKGTLDRVQRLAKKMVNEIKHLTYEKRLTKLNLTSLKERRERGDLIKFFKSP